MTTHVESSLVLFFEQQWFDDEHAWNTEQSQDEQHGLYGALSTVERAHICRSLLTGVVHQKHVDEI